MFLMTLTKSIKFWKIGLTSFLILVGTLDFLIIITFLRHFEIVR